MPIVFLIPVPISRLLVKIIYLMPSSGYFDEIIRSVGGLSTDSPKWSRSRPDLRSK